MELNLRNRVAVVTGGSKGIGLDIAKKISSEGVIVCLIARTKTDINRACIEIRDMGGLAYGYRADATCREQVSEAIASILSDVGQIDFLINNAGGVNKFGSFSELDTSDWLESFNLNVLGCVNFIRECELSLSKSDQARIITISSIAGLQPGFFNPHYSICKAATINLTKHLANIYAEVGILCNVICAGPVHSSSWDSNVKSLAKKYDTGFSQMYTEFEKKESAKIPLGRIGEPEDISEMVTFLLSSKAGWITGSCIQISGGK